MKLSFSQPKYIVNGNTTVCILTGTFSENNMVIIGKGIAKLSPYDTYDEYTGKKIALAKAEMDAYGKCARMAGYKLNSVDKFRSELIDFIDKAARTIVHNEDFILTF